MENVFIDSDIIMDLLGRREPFYPFAAQLFTLVDAGAVNAYVSPIIIANLYYLLSKLKNKEFAIISLRKLKLLVKVLPVDETVIDLALSSDFKDFEDSIQYHTAKENNIQTLLTRNKKDYKKAKITIMNAEEFLNVFRTGIND